MKGPKNPTFKQKQLIEKNRLNPRNWMIIKAPPGELHIQNRESKNIKILKVS